MFRFSNWKNIRSYWAIPVLYALFGVFWILTSDNLLAILFPDISLHQSQELQSGKGLAFVFITTFLLAGLIQVFVVRIRGSETQFLRLFIDNPSPMWVYDLNTLRFLAVNKAAVEHYGYSSSEFLSKTIADIRPREDLGLLQSNLAQTRNLLEETGIWRHMRRNGEVFFVNILSHRTIFHGKDARLVTSIDINDRVKMEQQLVQTLREVHEKEAYQHVLMASASTFMVRLNQKGEFLLGNELFGDRIGPVSALFNTPFIHILQPEDRDIFQNILHKALEHPGKIQRGTFRILLAQGAFLWTDWEWISLPDPGQNTVIVQGIGLDLTEKFTYLHSIETYKEELNRILSVVEDVIWAYHVPDLTVKYINPASTQILGFSPESIAENPRPCWALTHPDDMDRVRDFMRKLLVSGVQNSGEVAYRYLHPDGKMRHFLNRMTCVPEELPGRFLISGVLIDITAIREAEQKATNYGHRLTETFGQINDGFFSVDPELRLEYCNPRFESLMSFSKEAVTGKSWGDIFYSPDFQRLEKEIQSAYQTRRQARIESLFPSLKKWFRISIYPGPDSTAVFFHDITGEKLAQHEARMARQNLSALINNTQDQIWSVNPDYELVSANQPFLDRVKSITGRTLGIGDLVLDTNYREEDLITWKNYYDRVLSGESFEQLLTLSLEKMPDRFLEVRFYPIFGENNEVVAAGCFSRDITQRIQDQKRIAEQNSRLLEIHDLQSHNIRNHVATILALTSQFDFVNQAHPFNAEIIRFVEGESQKLDDKIHQVVRAANYAMDLQKEIFNHPQVEEGDSPEA